MKANLDSYLFKSLFITDRQGQLFFFPYGERKTGFLLTNKRQIGEIKEFTRASYLLSLGAMVLGLMVFHDFWGVMGSFVIPGVCGWLANLLYARRVTCHMPVSLKSHTDIFLDNIAFASEADPEEQDLSTIPNWKKTRLSPYKENWASRIKEWYYHHILKRLALLFMGAGFTMIGILGTFSNRYTGQPMIVFLFFATFFLFGIGLLLAYFTNRGADRPEGWPRWYKPEIGVLAGALIVLGGALMLLYMFLRRLF
jgi:hypothetical protein